MVSLNRVLIVLQSSLQRSITYPRRIAFKCTFKGCRQAFSVQSNMHHHACTHLQLGNEPQESGDEGENEDKSKEGSPKFQVIQEEVTGAT